MYDTSNILIKSIITRSIVICQNKSLYIVVSKGARTRPPLNICFETEMLSLQKLDLTLTLGWRGRSMTNSVLKGEIEEGQTKWTSLSRDTRNVPLKLVQFFKSNFRTHICKAKYEHNPKSAAFKCFVLFGSLLKRLVLFFIFTIFFKKLRKMEMCVTQKGLLTSSLRTFF